MLSSDSTTKHPRQPTGPGPTVGRTATSVFARTHGVDRVLAAAGSAVAALYWVAASSPGAGASDLALALSNTGLVCCLLFRSAFPISAASVTALLCGAMAAVGLVGPTPVSVSPLLVAAPLALSAITYRAPATTAGLVALIAAAIGSAASPIVQNSAAPLWAYSAHLAVLLIVHLRARWRRKERAFRRKEIESRAALARADERDRLASELHDILGHGLTVIHAHANARLAHADADADADASTETTDSLRTIRSIAKASIRDLRFLVGATSAPSDATHEGLREIPGLLAASRTAGVDLRTSVPDPAALSTWDAEVNADTRHVIVRCLREGLTNALRHGDASGHVDVELSRHSGNLELVIRNKPSDVEAERLRPPGTGLSTLRRRVEAVGGHLGAGLDAHVFRLQVQLPLDVNRAGRVR
ncbi:two-component sensor histidine kinase [Rhodococcus rhodnii]|uniref:histidine kinase n=3 Tax=Rhodococcus rhodnii TaxID=38312 RepID=R7WIY9_9NOCA|nr:hypothetical protein Rrhod_3431 [Rhodococcus rhodnii LMG 5362]TXG89233.1 two-component sensor histidine kinase [Rhodococcus rhodnii]